MPKPREMEPGELLAKWIDRLVWTVGANAIATLALGVLVLIHIYLIHD